MLVESFFQAAGTSTVEDYLGRSEAASTAAPEYVGNELLTTGPHPDAKLVELGVEYERLLALEEPLSEESARLWNAADRLRYQKLGIDPEDKEACRAALDDRHSEWMEARNSADKEVGYDKAWHKTDRASRKTARIGKKKHHCLDRRSRNYCARSDLFAMETEGAQMNLPKRPRDPSSSPKSIIDIEHGPFPSLRKATGAGPVCECRSIPAAEPLARPCWRCVEATSSDQTLFPRTRNRSETNRGYRRPDQQRGSIMLARF
jgi:hypothetical protein